MKISLVIPTYNDEKLVIKLLDSLTIQTRIPDEIIFCDNNCTDTSIDQIKKYLHKLPIKIIKETKQGIIPAMNTLCKTAKGDLILRTDTDAILPPFWVEKVEKHFINDPSLDACGGKWFSSDGPLFIKIGIKVGYYLFDPCIYLLTGHYFLSGTNFAIKSSTLKRINYYNTRLTIKTDDQLIFCKLKTYKCKFKRFRDCWLWHTTRRWNKKPWLVFYEMAGFINPKLYKIRSAYQPF